MSRQWEFGPVQWFSVGHICALSVCGKDVYQRVGRIHQLFGIYFEAGE